jgi:hypothetical protein
MTPFTYPQVLSISDAHQYLESRQICYTSALAMLDKTLASVNLLDLFSRRFPAEYEAFQPPQDRPPLIAIAATFFELMGRLFPMPDFWGVEDELIEECFACIPLDSLIPNWDECDPADFPFYHQLGAALAGFHDLDAVLRPRLGNKAADFQDMPERIDPARLTELCDTEGGPVPHLILAVNIACRNTDCFWIDLSPDMAGADMADWSDENIEFLTQQATLCTELLAKADSFDKWLLASPANLYRACELWKQAGVTTNE